MRLSPVACIEKGEEEGVRRNIMSENPANPPQPAAKEMRTASELHSISSYWRRISIVSRRL